MRVLFITNMYPVPDYIYFGIHVKEQIEAIEKVGKIEKVVYFINGRESKRNYFVSIFAIKKLITSENFDLIHIHYGLSALFLLFVKPLIPVVVTLHSGELFRKKGYINHLFQKFITLSILKKAKKVIVLNDDMIALLVKYKNKLVKLPCGTDISYFKELSFDSGENRIIIGFPGNKGRKEKNFTLFSNIIDKLKATCDVEIIEFHNLKRDEVVQNLNKIDLLLMTSLIEGSPQIIKEAMACNKPIVSTAVGDVTYLLKGVRNCYIVNSFSANDFVDPIYNIIKLNKRERRSDGRDRLVQLGLDSNSVAESVYSLYQEIL